MAMILQILKNDSLFNLWVMGELDLKLKSSIKALVLIIEQYFK